MNSDSIGLPIRYAHQTQSPLGKMNAAGCLTRCLLFTLSIATLSSERLKGEWPDISSVPQDLSTPALEDGEAEAGKRVRATIEPYRETKVYHAIYLPTDWQPGNRYPVIVEYAGNGPYRNAIGDTCTGKVEDCNLGYGISGGRQYIWLCLPYISEDHQHNQLQWWGDIEATVGYCKSAVEETCQRYGGDPDRLFLAGFSRGAIACNYIGLHDDEIARLWAGFICHSHYDGVREWNYESSDSDSANERLRRLNGRPQFISHEGSVEATRSYLAKACPEGNFTFQTIEFRNHTDQWVLRDIPPRQRLRDWLQRIGESRSTPSNVDRQSASEGQPRS